MTTPAREEVGAVEIHVLVAFHDPPGMDPGQDHVDPVPEADVAAGMELDGPRVPAALLGRQVVVVDHDHGGLRRDPSEIKRVLPERHDDDRIVSDSLATHACYHVVSSSSRY